MAGTAFTQPRSPPVNSALALALATAAATATTTASNNIIPPRRQATKSYTSPEPTPSTSPIQIPVRHGPIPSTMKPDSGLPARSTSNPPKKTVLAIRTFSPVNANGCFEFDRVLKSGNVLKRTRKTKSWKQVHLVLRPQTLSLYADTEGTRLRHQIQLSDITAVARQRDPKKKERHVFALFSSERNYHIEAPSEQEAQQWVELIRTQARIDEEEDEIIALMSPALERPPGASDGGFFGRSASATATATTSNTTNAPAAGETSASEIDAAPPIHMKKSRSRSNGMHSAAGASARKVSAGLAHMSGAEQASYSDFSDTGGGPSTTYPDSSLSLPQLRTQAEKDERARKVDEIYRPSATADGRPTVQRSASGLSARNFAAPVSDAERVVYNGYLYLLRSKGGMRQWKSVWAVLRAKSLALYKNDDEYQPLHIIPFAAILEALDIDNVSRSKRHCFQIITEERQFKFCARSEEDLVKWVGGFKALLAKRREVERAKEDTARGGAAAAAATAVDAPVTVR